MARCRPQVRTNFRWPRRIRARIAGSLQLIIHAAGVPAPTPVHRNPPARRRSPSRGTRKVGFTVRRCKYDASSRTARVGTGPRNRPNPRGQRLPREGPARHWKMRWKKKKMYIALKTRTELKNRISSNPSCIKSIVTGDETRIRSRN